MVGTKTLCPSKSCSMFACPRSLKAMEMERDGKRQYWRCFRSSLFVFVFAQFGSVCSVR